MDVRYPNGAQCTFGGQGASFIELCVPVSSGLGSLRDLGSRTDGVTALSPH
jgi:hypothetical protein